MSKLKAIKPNEIEKRLKLFLYGPSGTGKTLASLQFPNAYIIDTEKGCENYSKTINDQNSVVFQSNDHNEIREQLIALLSESHDYTTLIIDPMTIVAQSIQDYWTRKFERKAIADGNTTKAEMQDFGIGFWGKVKSEYKSIQRLLMKLDMNVIITAHQKDVYGAGMAKLGVTFDSMKGDDYFFDNVFRLENQNGKRIAITEKQRTDIGKSKFPISFEWTYDNFLKFYGQEIIQKKAEIFKIAEKEKVDKLLKMIESLNIDKMITDKWLDKADTDTFYDFSDNQIDACIEFCNKKLEALK